MNPDELAEVIRDLQRLQMCRIIMGLEPTAAVTVAIGDTAMRLLLTGEEVAPLAQQVEQRIVARLQAKGVTIPGVGT